MPSDFLFLRPGIWAVRSQINNSVNTLVQPINPRGLCPLYIERGRVPSDLFLNDCWALTYSPNKIHHLWHSYYHSAPILLIFLLSCADDFGKVGMDELQGAGGSVIAITALQKIQ